jgi:GTP-binding protein Era
MEKLGAFVSDIVPVSALGGDGVAVLRDLIAENLPEGPHYFPDDYITARQERFLIAEMIREKALMHLNQEIPHGIGVEIMGIKRAPSGVVHIDATIYCERDAHKNIIIGKHGVMIGRIGSQARPDIEKMLDARVNLKLWVKVVPDWRNRQSELKTLGYLDN